MQIPLVIGLAMGLIVGPPVVNIIIASWGGLDISKDEANSGADFDSTYFVILPMKYNNAAEYTRIVI